MGSMLDPRDWETFFLPLRISLPVAFHQQQRKKDQQHRLTANILITAWKAQLTVAFTPRSANTSDRALVLISVAEFFQTGEENKKVAHCGAVPAVTGTSSSSEDKTTDLLHQARHLCSHPVRHMAVSPVREGALKSCHSVLTSPRRSHPATGTASLTYFSLRSRSVPPAWKRTRMI